MLGVQDVEITQGYEIRISIRVAVAPDSLSQPGCQTADLFLALFHTGFSRSVTDMHSSQLQPAGLKGNDVGSAGKLLGATDNGSGHPGPGLRGVWIKPNYFLKSSTGL
jgi:hypothetical protein